MKIRFFLIITSILITQVLFAITVDGNAYLEAQTDHSGIEIIFERISPDSLLFTTYTDINGYYSMNIETGVYYIRYFKYGYIEYSEYENLFSDITLPNITLLEHSSMIIVPIDFSTIQSAIDYTIHGDTIIVQPGLYIENLDLSNKNITLASYYFTTQDTSYIAQTIIDGGESDSVVKIFYGQETILCGFTIINGSSDEFGGGIHCHNSDPILSNLVISENTTVDDGGGIYCYHSSPIIENSIISYNDSDLGGGVFCEENSSPQILDTKIMFNSARSGAGFMCKNPSEPYLENVLICNNQGVGYSLGGGINLGWHTTATIINSDIYNNYAQAGAGIFCSFHAEAFLSSVNIFNNTAISSGAGILCSNDGLVQFDDQNRCNLYSNNISDTRGYGKEIFCSSYQAIEVIVDTFSTFTPTDFYAAPIGNFTFDILHAIQDSLIDQDVYVSEFGDNENSGLSPEEPFQTIRYALSQVRADSLNPRVINVLPGLYSHNTNNEVFPIQGSSYVSIVGFSVNEVILDAQNESSVFRFGNTKKIMLKNLTIQNGSATGINDHGGGLSVYHSEVVLENVRVSNNFAEDWGGAILCYESEMLLRNVEISENDNNIDVIYTINSTIDFINSSIVNNTSYNPVIYSFGYSYLSFQNCIFWNNSSYNSIVCNNNGQENILTFSYTDLKNGQNSILHNAASTTINWLDGNIELNPMFDDTSEFPYSLEDESPCVNSGIPDTTGLNLPEFDLAGNPRIYGGRIDMGTYENQNVVVSTDESLIPLVTKLNQNYPNPFNPTTTISFSIPEETKVDLSIYNIKGQKIRTLINDQIEAGEHSVVWDGVDSLGKKVSSGLYLYKLKINNKTEIVKKCMLLK